MANWTNLKAAIADNIKINGNQEITGQVLQNTLTNIVNAVGENATFAGIATPTTNPGTPDGPVFYIASEIGTYNNFGGLEVQGTETVIFYWSDSKWAKKSIGVLNQFAFDNLEAAIAKKGTQITDFTLNAGWWGGTAAASHTNWNYTDPILVSGGDTISVEGEGGSNARLVFYHSTNGVILYRAAELVNRCIVNITEPGYIICNSTVNTDLKIYKLDNTASLARLNNNSWAAKNYLGYAGIFGKAPILSTISQTFTIPAESLIAFNGLNIYNTNEIVVKSPEVEDKWGAHYIIINTSFEIRTVPSKNLVHLGHNEFLLAMVRWQECVYEANFSKYYLDDRLVELKPKATTPDDITPANMQRGYYSVSNYKVGDRLPRNMAYTSTTANFWCSHFIAPAGSAIHIKGIGGSGLSRLYLIADYATREILQIAESAEDAYTNPKTINLTKNSDVYITLTSSSDYYTYKISKPQLSTLGSYSYAFQTYAGLFGAPPILNKETKTFTIPKGTIIASPIIAHSSSHIQLATDIVFSQTDNSIIYGTGFCIINTKTLAKRVVNANQLVVLDEDEAVLAMVRWQECVYEANFSKYYLDDRLVELKPTTNSVSSGVVAPKMYNPTLNLQKTQLRVLDIGNSYTVDATHYLSNIVSDSNIDTSDMCLYAAIRGGASFKSWYDLYHDQDSLSYGIYRVVGGLTADISGTADIKNGEKFRNTLNNNEWDLILIHQVSNYAPYFDRWEENSDAGYLSKFIRLLRKCQPKATIGFLLVHSYWSNYSANTEQSSLERWKLIANSAEKLRANYGIDFIIPYGTAIQNLRASSLNNEYDLTADGTHCANGIADYTAACTYFQSLFAPRYGVNILGNTTRIVAEQTSTYPSSNISVTDETAPTCQKAAFLAAYNWYECQNPDNIDDENLV